MNFLFFCQPQLQDARILDMLLRKSKLWICNPGI